jgi:hypothetical protein
MEHIVIIQWDEEATVWYAICDSIPLALEDESLDTLINRIKLAAPEMLAENGNLVVTIHTQAETILNKNTQHHNFVV